MSHRFVTWSPARQASVPGETAFSSPAPAGLIVHCNLLRVRHIGQCGAFGEHLTALRSSTLHHVRLQE